MIYFIADSDTLATIHSVKIGFTSNNPEWRLGQLQTGSSRTLTLIGCIPGTVEDEVALHRRFKELHSHGEWFRAEAPFWDYYRDLQLQPPGLLSIQAEMRAPALPAPLSRPIKPKVVSNTPRTVKSKQPRTHAIKGLQAEELRTNPKPLMTLLEASAYLCHSPRKVRELVHLRRLPCVNLTGGGRGKLLFRLADLDEAIAKASRQAI